MRRFSSGFGLYGLFRAKGSSIPCARAAAESSLRRRAIRKKPPERVWRLSVIDWSGRRGSNSRHSAWKADALPTELLPRGKKRGRRWIRTTEVERQQIYSLPHLATLVFARTTKNCFAVANIRTYFECASPRRGFFQKSAFCEVFLDFDSRILARKRYI